ncbi:MAG: folate hydrolase, partial [Gammaproteobacteria bacterium]|nr:folate hydrolase [Gammaproteobacteria bacterium]
LRLANATLLPFDFTTLLETVSEYATEVQELADTMRKETARVNKLIAGGEFKTALDPTKDYGPPARHAPVPHFNFAPLQNALAALKLAVEENQQQLDDLDLDALAPSTLGGLNTLLYTAERLMTREEGLPGREWYRHYLYAPGFYTGYGVKTLPAIREAIEQRRYDLVDPGMTKTAEVIEALAERVAEITRSLRALKAPGV